MWPALIVSIWQKEKERDRVRDRVVKKKREKNRKKGRGTSWVLWILPGNVQAPDYFLIKSVCVLVIYKRLALIFSRSCALSDDILIFHKHRIRWGGCVYVFLILHRIPATLKLVFFSPCTIPSFFSLSCFFSWLCSSLNCCLICDPITQHYLGQKKEHMAQRTVHSFVRMAML